MVVLASVAAVAGAGGIPAATPDQHRQRQPKTKTFHWARITSPFPPVLPAPHGQQKIGADCSFQTPKERRRQDVPFILKRRSHSQKGQSAMQKQSP